jgi:hypothetical protein
METGQLQLVLPLSIWHPADGSELQDSTIFHIAKVTLM